MSGTTVDELRERLAEAERRSDEFLSLVTHELKTPLTPLKAVSQLIRSRIRRARAAGQAPDLDVLERNLASIERQVDRMAGLINDLLEISRAQRGTFRLQPEPLDLVELVRTVVGRHVDAVQEEVRHNVSLDAPEVLPAFVDRSRVEQALSNLIGNAIKFSPRGGDVFVRLRDQDGNALIEVRDEGVGIRSEDLGRVGHAPFVRGKTEGSFAGLGTGLYLARLVAEGHGGSLEVKSEGQGKGTIVSMSLRTAETA